MSKTTVVKWLPADAQKRRWLAVALLILLSAIVIAAIAVPAVLLHRHYDDSIAKLSRQISTQTAFNALRPRLAEKLELLKARDVRKFFLKGASSALALAELQESVRATIESTGGRVNGASTPANAPKDDGPYRQVATALTFNANNANLRRILHALEAKEPYHFVDTVVIQPQVGSGWRPTPGAAEPELYVQLDVHAFALRAPEVPPPVTTPAEGATPPAPAKARSTDVAPPRKGGAA
jgi:general secretion pathway protein M